MIYCMSDIHGDYDRYINLLNLIQFSNNDTLFFLGDACDRGEQCMQVLLDMMTRTNVIPIMGNHDYMALRCLCFLRENLSDEQIAAFSAEDSLDYSGWIAERGRSTITDFMRLSDKDQNRILMYLRSFSLYQEVDVEDHHLVMTHGDLGNFSEDKPLSDYTLKELMFSRIDYTKRYFRDDNKYLVTGHTPTRLFYQDFFEIDTNIDRIFVRNHHIAIDCGCGYGGKLCCVRMEDLEPFYL